MNNVHYSSKSNEWATPPEFFEGVNREFRFTLDACATADNAKCGNYFSPDLNGLKQDWPGVVWCNPPYGREIGKWVKKAHEESRRGSTVVMLIPARTDTSYFHDYILGHAEIRFLRGRLYFTDAQGKNSGRAPFPSMLVIFRPQD